MTATAAPDLLATIVAATRTAVAVRERARPLAAPRAPGAGGSAERFADALTTTPAPRIIAECKRRSPSRGILRQVYDPAAHARAYEGAGAAAISVLTEPTFFDGSLDHLAAVRGAVRLPLLRKDFVVTPYQVHEAALAGADAVLLIAAALGDGELAELRRCATDLGLAALVEVHDERDLDRALAAGASIVGVNSRNLRTLTVDRDVFDRLGPVIPDEVIAVAESGIRTPEDLRRGAALGFDAFLVGERLIAADDPGAALRALRMP